MPSETGDRLERAEASLPRILAFHKSQPGFSYGATNYSPKRLRDLVRLLIGERYRFSSLEEVVGVPSERSVAITFDDGYRHLKDVLPSLIEDFDLKPTVFVPTDLIGRDNSWDYSYRLSPCPHLRADDIASLSTLGVEFGSHGASHSALTHLTAETSLEELSRSSQRLEEITGRSVTAISYPFGRVDATVIDTCREAGYRRGFTMAYPRRSDTRLTLGRMAVHGFDTPLTILKKLSMRGPGHRLEACKAALTNRLAGGSILLNRLRG